MKNEPTYKVGDAPILNEKAYVVRGLDLLWYGKKFDGGEIICSANDRAIVEHELKLLGYKLTK